MSCCSAVATERKAHGTEMKAKYSTTVSSTTEEDRTQPKISAELSSPVMFETSRRTTLNLWRECSLRRALAGARAKPCARPRAPAPQRNQARGKETAAKMEEGSSKNRIRCCTVVLVRSSLRLPASYLEYNPWQASQQKVISIALTDQAALRRGGRKERNPKQQFGSRCQQQTAAAWRPAKPRNPKRQQLLQQRPRTNSSRAEEEVQRTNHRGQQEANNNKTATAATNKKKKKIWTT